MSKMLTPPHPAPRGGPPRRRRLLRAALLASLLPWLGQLRAAPALPAFLKVVTVAVKPWGWIDAGGAPQGIFVDFVRQLALESGLRLDISVVPYPRAVAMIGSGSGELLLALDSAILLRSAQQVAATPIGDVVVIMRRDVQAGSLRELRGKVVAQVRTTEYTPEFDADPLILKGQTIGWDQSMKMLIAKRYDAAIGMRASLLYAVHQLGLRRSELGEELFVRHASASLHYSKVKYDARLASKLAAAVAGLNRRGLMTRLIDDSLREAPAVP